MLGAFVSKGHFVDRWHQFEEYLGRGAKQPNRYSAHASLGQISSLDAQRQRELELAMDSSNAPAGSIAPDIAATHFCQTHSRESWK